MRRLWLARLLWPCLLLLCTGCQLSYYLHSAYNQSKLVVRREPISRALKREDLTSDEKHKLQLVGEAKAFGEADLGLKQSDNYTSFVKLNDRYVTYIVQAAYARELKPYLWKFPFVGEMPYKGYFSKDLADEEARSFNPEEYDTYVRGVTAYSTLGWFQDSVLSSMLRYDDHELVEVILHETVHTTLFVKGAAEFNERMATFLGQEGMKLFYRRKEGEGSANLKKAEEDSHDQKLFSAFLTKEIEDLKKWYGEKAGSVTPETKAARLKEIQDHYLKDLKPKLLTQNYSEFEKRDLNNAKILAYQTYEYSLEDFEKLFRHFGGDFKKTLEHLKGYASDPKPEATLKAFVQSLP